MIHRSSWASLGATLRAALRAMAGPTLPLPPSEPSGLQDAELMAAEIEAFVRALDADLITASDFAD